MTLFQTTQESDKTWDPTMNCSW